MKKLILGLALAAVLAAGAATPAQAQQDEFAAYDGTLLDFASRYLFVINRQLYRGIDATLDWATDALSRGETVETAATAGTGVGRVLSNLINEPLTALASVVTGDTKTAGRAVERFTINTTEGILGWYDRAAERGLTPVHTDAGLALCVMGVSEGGYIVLPLVGPRTLRDAAADIALTTAILYGTVLGLGGVGAGIQTIIILETVEIIGDVVATRQIDPLAKALNFDDYDTMRREYLTQRRQRCVREASAAARIP